TTGITDSAFGLNGCMLIDLGDSTDDMLTAVDLQADGKIIVAGFSEMLSSFQNVVLRINTNGKIDSTFGVNGLTNVPVMGLTKMEVQPDDKIVVAGIMVPNTALVRLNADGTTDSTFGTNGLVQQSISTRDECQALALQADGKILVGGRSYKADALSRTSFTLARLNTNGTPDSTFSNNGLLTHTVGGTNLGRRHDEILAIAQQPDGKIVVAGKTIIKGLNDDAMVLARFTSDGLIDPAFNDSGEVIVNLTGSAERAFDMKLLPNGKIAVLLAPELHYSNYNYAVVMFEPKLPLGLPYTGTNEARVTVFPNPAQATATLQFELKEEAILSASVLDMQGRQVASLFTNKLHIAGKHNYSLEKLLPSGGMYLVQLQNKNSVQQVTLIKQ
ncbi:MAG: T9SS type A sorting domain-containing protein, partial [Chitinophagales bacterium]|nr:T9SS type A sorting domain-containing protein [Chitinophagales bacterium]